MKSSKVSVRTGSTPASLSFGGQATRHTTVKWSINGLLSSFSFKLSDEETMCIRECFGNIYVRDGLEKFNE